jgi:hypothetical protein
LFELSKELRSERFIVANNKRGPVDLRDHVRHRERLAGTRHAKQYLRVIAARDRFDKLRDRFRLIAGGFVIGYELKQLRIKN